MKYVIIVCLALIAKCCLGQGGVGMTNAIQDLDKRQRTGAIDDVDRPLEEEEGLLPEQDPSLSQRLRIIHADTGTIDGTKLNLFGNVVILYKGYRLEGESIRGDTSTEIFELVGNSRVSGLGDIVSTEGLIVNLREETYTFQTGTATISPESLGYGVEAPFYITAGSGSLLGGHFHVINGRITSCDKLEPHYAFEVGYAEVEPGRYLKMEDVKFKILGRTVLGLEDLYIPLYENRPRYTPTVGQSRDEGYYIKGQYTTPLNSRDLLTSRLDLMSRLGVGIGGDYSYLNDFVAGGLSVYTIFGAQQTLLGKWLHNQRIGSTSLSADAQYSKNNYLTAPNSAILNTRLQVNVPGSLGRNGTSNLAGYRSSSETGDFSTTNETIGLSDIRTWDSDLQTNLNLNYSNNLSESGANLLSQSKRLDLRFYADQPLRSFRAQLLYQRAVPIGEQTFFNNGSDQTPVLTLTTDDRKLFGTREGTSDSPLPFTLGFSVGELRDPGLTNPITRMTFATTTQGQFALQRGTNAPEGSSGLAKGVDILSSPARDTLLEWQAQFYQGVYSDDTAQYSLQYGANLRHKFGHGSVLELRYQTQRQFGYTPLSIDRRYRNDAFNGGVELEFGAGWTASAHTGYDVLLADQGRVPWQIVNIRGGYQHKNSKFDISGSYDTFNTRWGYVRATGGFLIGDTRFSVGARFDAARSIWSAGSLIVEGLKMGKLTANILLSYNGFTKDFDAQQYSLRYDLHCTEAILEITDFKRGFRSGRQIAFYIRIKALPFGTDFGVGRRGQSVGGVGGFGG